MARDFNSYFNQFSQQRGQKVQPGFTGSATTRAPGMSVLPQAPTTQTVPPPAAAPTATATTFPAVANPAPSTPAVNEVAPPPAAAVPAPTMATTSMPAPPPAVDPNIQQHGGFDRRNSMAGQYMDHFNDIWGVQRQRFADFRANQMQQRQDRQPGWWRARQWFQRPPDAAPVATPPATQQGIAVGEPTGVMQIMPADRRYFDKPPGY